MHMFMQVCVEYWMYEAAIMFCVHMIGFYIIHLVLILTCVQ